MISKRTLMYIALFLMSSFILASCSFGKAAKRTTSPSQGNLVENKQDNSNSTGVSTDEKNEESSLETGTASNVSSTKVSSRNTNKTSNTNTNTTTSNSQTGNSGTTNNGNAPESLWKLAWSDDFNGSGIDTSKWNFVEGGGGYGNNELQNYTSRPENAKIQNGNLVITAKREDYNGNNYTSAKLTTQGKGHWTYGKYEIRAKLPEGQGLWPAFWMMPEDMDMYGGWPGSGEIDIMEYIGSEPNRVFGTLHYGNPWKYTGKDYYLPEGQKFSDDYHVFELEWAPGEIKWYVDGKLYQVQKNWYSRNLNEGDAYTYPAPFDRDFYLQLNMAVGGNLPGNPNDDSIFPRSFLVDYVRVYEYKGSYTEADPSNSGPRKPLADGNYIYNGSFDQTVEGVDSIEGVLGSSYWQVGTSLGGDFTPSIENGMFKGVINNPGSQTYSVQLMQSPLYLKKGATYKLSFDAKASSPRNIIAKASMVGGSWTSYSGDEPFNLTTEMKTYSREFTMNGETDEGARLDFNIGKEGGTVYLDNVRLEMLSDAPPTNTDEIRKPLASGNYIYNGSFDQGTDRMGFWNLSLQNGGEAETETSNRELYVRVKSKGTSPESIRLYQEPINLEKDETYIVSFNARSNQYKNLIVSAGSRDGSTSYSGIKSFTLTETMTKYSFEFAMNSNEDAKARLEFLLGKDTKDVYIDNVSLIKKAKPPVINDTKETIVEAESFESMSGVEVGPCNDTTGGNAVGYIDDGDWMDYKVNVEKAGTYTVSYRIAGGDANRIGKIDLMSSGTLLSSADMKYTGGWDSWSTVKTTVQLEEGLQTIRLYANKGGFNINYIKFIYGDLTNPGGGISGNLVLNGGFDEGTDSWNHFMADWDGCYSTTTVENGLMKVAIAYEGPQNWSTQLAQEKIKLEKGVTYVLSFDAKSTVARNIEVILERSGGDYLKYFGPQIASLTTDLQRFNYEFTMDKDTDEVSHLVFALGKIGDAGILGEHDVYFDNVILKVKQPENMLLNGNFDEGTDSWNHFKADWDGAAGAATVENGLMKVAIGYEGPQNWSTQLAQEGLNIEKGATYELSFDAKSTVARNIEVILERNSGDYLKYFGPQIAALTTDMQHFNYEFTMDKDTDEVSHLVFALGKIGDAGVIGAHDVYFDNILLVKKSDGGTDNGEPGGNTGGTPIPSGTDLISNGSFDSVIDPWGIWFADWEGAYSQGSVLDGQAKVAISYEGNANWSTQFFQNNLTIEKDATYIVSFDARSTTARNIEVMIEQASAPNTKYFDNNAIGLTNEMQHFAFEFTMTGDTDSTAHMVFALGKILESDPVIGVHDIYLDNISVVKK